MKRIAENVSRIRDFYFGTSSRPAAEERVFKLNSQKPEGIAPKQIAGGEMLTHSALRKRTKKPFAIASVRGSIKKYFWKSFMLGLLFFGFVAVSAQETESSPAPIPSPSPAAPLPSAVPSPRPTAAAQRPAQGDALAAYRQGQFQVAIEITLRELSFDPRNMDSYAVLCWSLNALKRHREAIDYAQRGRQLNPGDHRLVGILAEANYALRNDSLALSYYQQYLSMIVGIQSFDQRYFRDSYRDMAEIFIRFGELHHADMALSSAIMYEFGQAPADNIRVARLHARQGFVREELKDNAHALASYQKALEKDPNNQDARAGRIRLQTVTAAP